MSKIFTIRALLLITIPVTAGSVEAGKRKTHDKTDDRRRVIGDIYDPGTGGRLQIRDKRGRIIGYIERDGDITDKRRRKVGSSPFVGSVSYPAAELLKTFRALGLLAEAVEVFWSEGLRETIKSKIQL